MGIADWLIVIAILLAPVVAVRVETLLELRREKRRRKNLVFETLMGTRADRVSQDHVQALNMIDIEFSRKPSKADQEVVKAWKIYLDHLNDQAAREDKNRLAAWGARGALSITF